MKHRHVQKLPFVAQGELFLLSGGGELGFKPLRSPSCLLPDPSLPEDFGANFSSAWLFY